MNGKFFTYTRCPAGFSTEACLEPTLHHVNLLLQVRIDVNNGHKSTDFKWILFSEVRGSQKQLEEELTALINESRTLMAKAVPQAKGWVRYSSVSGSSSSSWSRN